MPTHFSKLEGSPSNMQRERRRRRWLVATTPEAGFEERDVSSIVTAREHNNLHTNFSYRMDHSREVPQYISVQNWRRLQNIQQHEIQRQNSPSRAQERHRREQRQQYERRSTLNRYPQRQTNIRSSQGHRPPQYDEYCETRVSTIPSFPSQSWQGSSRVSSLTSDPRSFRVSSLSSRPVERCNSPSRTRERRPPSPSRQHDGYPSSPGVNPQTGVHTLVNAHGVFGMSGDRNSTDKKENYGARRVSTPTKMRSISQRGRVKHNSYGDPNARNIYISRRRENIIGVERHGDDETTLQGERFATAFSDSEGSPKDFVYDSHHILPNQSRGTREASTAAGSAGSKWLCDVCKEARFDNYVDAYRHEKECRQRKNNSFAIGIQNTENSYQRGKERVGNHSNHHDEDQQRRRIDHIGMQLQDMSLSSSTDSPPADQCRIPTTSEDRDDPESVTSKDVTRWLCSVCKEVSFDNYADACSHEKICKIRMEATADRPKTARKDAVRKIRMDAITSAWEAAEKPMGTNDRDRYLPMVELHREARQEENDRGDIESQARHDTLDTVEREQDRGGNRPMSPFDFVSQNKKGEAYDRYVILANEQEEEEDRERYIALAKQTREEELMSFEREDEEERYVCLA